MEWDSRARSEFIKMPLARSAKENARVMAEKFARRNRSPAVTLKELDEAKTICYEKLTEATRLKELDRRIAEGETNLKQQLQQEGEEVLNGDVDLFKVEICHAQYFRCRSQIADVRVLKRTIEAKLREMKVTEMVVDSLPDDVRLMAHHRFIVSLSGCPNGCTGPETRPFGIHGASRPMVTGKTCSECFSCVDHCRRGAIVIRDGGPRINVALCDHCENCVKVCPTGKIVSQQKGYRIMVGGKFGRFHQVGQELFKIADDATLMKALEAAVQTVKEKSVGHEDLYSITRRLGVAPIFRRLFDNGALENSATPSAADATSPSGEPACDKCCG